MKVIILRDISGNSYHLLMYDMVEESHRRVQTEGFQCSETLEKNNDGITSVVFHCNLPYPSNDIKLSFSCREPSVGALENDEDAAKLSDEDYTVDPNFFDTTYTMAGSTGFKVWTGTRLLIETLAWPDSNDCERLKELRQSIRKGAKIIELGAGVGVVGTYLASVGAQVLITDLPTLVENAIDNNLALNATSSQTAEEDGCPSWLALGYKIGNGWCASAALDWTSPLGEQLTREQSSVAYIIASDVVFLKSMLDSLLQTVKSIFQASYYYPTFILSFQRRDAQDGKESSLFTTVDGVKDAIKARGWKIDCLAWRPVMVSREIDGKVSDVESEVFVFEITP